VPLPAPISSHTLAGRRPDRQGKVRDIYEFDDRVLIVATDRISAFDYVLGQASPTRKGAHPDLVVLVRPDAIDRTEPCHATDPSRYPPEARGAADLPPRAIDAGDAHRTAADRMRRARVSFGLGVEDYQALAKSCGIGLPKNLRESDRLPNPLFTPATKAQSGHDINISEKEAAALVGQAVLDRVRDLTLRLYAEGAAHAESCAIIVADTKFEFGLLPDGSII